MRRLIFTGMLICVTGFLSGAERKPIDDVSQESMLLETQPAIQGITADHFAVCWWIPNEYWEVSFSQDRTVSDFERKELLKILDGVSILAVVQADVGLFGNFDYYAKNEIEQNLAVKFTNADGKTRSVKPLTDFDPNVKSFLDSMRPVLVSNLGGLGENYHFFVLPDTTKSDKRLLNPYEDGKITIEMATTNDDTLTSDLYVPLNSLYIPRKCPNGRDAHVSWKFCPWTGKPLDE